LGYTLQKAPLKLKLAIAFRRVEANIIPSLPTAFFVITNKSRFGKKIPSLEERVQCPKAYLT
jgi:hypothetical protein